MVNGVEKGEQAVLSLRDEREDVQEMASAAEALLFASAEPLALADLRRVLAVRQALLERVLEHLGRSLAEGKRGVRLQKHGDAVRLVTAPENAIYIEKLRGQQATQRLSDAALEVLALLAYSGPSTKPQLEAVRGVDCSGVLNTLMSRGLVEEVGRLETVGHPTLFNTTMLFLQHFGLEGTHQLPPVGAVARKTSLLTHHRGTESTEKTEVPRVFSVSFVPLWFVPSGGTMSAAETYSPGLEGVIAGETAVCTVADGLSYRGYPVAELAEANIGGEGRYALLQVVPEGRLGPDEAGPFVEGVERTAESRAPSGAAVLVGGFPAENLRYAATVYESLPLAVAAVFGATFVLLLVAFRSLAVPLLSIAMNTLSVGAALGLLVLVFQEGYGGGLLGLPAGGLGSLEEVLPITVFALTFGLSMDYQVFLLSRVQEERLAGRSVRESIEEALASTGRVISFAALIMLVVFAAFLVSDLAGVQALGFGLAVAVFLDATLVRLVLVPALLRLAGERVWWLPKPLQRALPAVAGGRTPERAPKTRPDKAGPAHATQAPSHPGGTRPEERR